MKTKYNNSFSLDDNQTEQHGSYIQNFLEEEINFLLAPSANQISCVDFEDIYIHNPEMERILEGYKKYTKNNNICIIEGFTGSGKSMLVRHVFNIHSLSVRIEDSSLIIPFTFDNALHADIKSIFVRMIHAACNILEESYPALPNVNSNFSELYQFIKLYRHDLLLHRNEFPEPSQMNQLQALLKENPLAFYSCVLKFYLHKTDVCPVNNIVIVVDDIEGIRLEDDKTDILQQELLPIKMVLELCECMQNRGGHAVSWSLNTVICCRHYVSRMMRTLPFTLDEQTTFSQKLEAYAVCRRIDLKKSPPLLDIINKRYEAICKKEIHNKVKWIAAMQVVKQLLDKVDTHVIDFILDLTLRNMRESMTRVKHLVLNKRWIQRDYISEHPGAFVITDLEQYNVKPASLIRAIGMNESVVYNSSASIIPNLLYNDNLSNIEIFPLLTLKYFLNIAQFNEMSWDSSISIVHFKKTVAALFNCDEYSSGFESSVYYLLKHRILLRSYDQEQFDNRALNSQTITQVERVYVPGMAVDLWKRLSTTSVFFEMYIDDIWLENDSREKTKQQCRGFDMDNFGVCIDYMSTLISAEQRIRAQAINHTHSLIRYKECFGEDFVSSHILTGLETSLNSYFRQENPNNLAETITVNGWKKAIHDYKKMLLKK